MLFNHSSFGDGCSPRVLNRLFQAYIFPHFLYGAPLWIFCLRERFRYTAPILHGYGKRWANLRGWYRRCARAVLGVHPTTSGEAILVRLVWLPLDYLLACYGIRWFVKCWFGRCGALPLIY